jgi:hypothetical protein
MYVQVPSQFQPQKSGLIHYGLSVEAIKTTFDKNSYYLLIWAR